MTYLPELSLPNLARQLRSGELPLLDYLDILEVWFEQREPSVLAFVPEYDRFGRLMAEAQALLRQYPDPDRRPTLFGVPVGVKDIFHVAGFVTRAGSQLPSEPLQGAEAAAVTALKNAGALIFGKTVTTEFAYFAPGPTRNPHHPDHTPGGSSSGSAAAVGAGLVPLTFGTQTIGSINRPAAFCGVVGYKPSYERISRRGVIPLSPSLDHVGLFAVDCAGISLTAAYLCADWQPLSQLRRRPVLGVPLGPYLEHAEPAGLAHFQETCQQLAATGFAVKEVEVMADFAGIHQRHLDIMAYEMAQVHREWYDAHRDQYHPKTLALIEQGRKTSSEAAARGAASRLELRQLLRRVMAEQRIDIWLSPAAPGPAPSGLDSTGSPVMNLPWTHSGLPSVNFPTGRSEQDLPLGLQLAGGWYHDEELLLWADSVRRSLPDWS